MKNVIKWFRIIFRLILFAGCVLLFLSRGFFIHWTVKDINQRKRRFAVLERDIQGLCCRLFGVKVKLINEPPKNVHGLFVGNHLGFLDILVIGGSRPLLFVTSQEMRETPFLGLLTEMAGCIYVERRSRTGIQDELKNLVDSLKAGHSICLFPEATSHNGERVLPFKRTLMTAAAHARVPIFPYTFNFTEIDGEPFTLKNRDSVCWYGSIPFHTALFATFSLKSVTAEIKFHEPFYYKLDMDRGQVADSLHDQIANDFKVVQFN